MNNMALMIGIGILAFSLILLIRFFGAKKAKSKRSLENISRQFYENTNEESVLIEDDKIDRFGEAFVKVPLIGGMYKKLKLAGIRIPFILFLILFNCQ